MTPTIELALIHYVESLYGKPFEFGVNDCPLFVAGALDIISGSSHRQQLEGQWHDKRSAWRYIKENGDIPTHLRNAGCTTVDFPQMVVGDIVCMEQKLAHEKKWHSAGVCMGLQVAIMTNENGLILADIGSIPNGTEVYRWE